jgi:hypothetical protein
LEFATIGGELAAIIMAFRKSKTRKEVLPEQVNPLNKAPEDGDRSKVFMRRYEYTFIWSSMLKHNLKMMYTPFLSLEYERESGGRAARAGTNFFSGAPSHLPGQPIH